MNIEIKVVHLALFYDEYKYISITIFLNRPLIGVNFCKRGQGFAYDLPGVFPSPYRG